MSRVRLGIPGLDDILYGGLVRGNALLVEGTPGSGKTNLGMQFVHAGVTQFDEPGLIVTFEEFPSQMYRDAAEFGWDLRALADADRLKIISTSPEVFQQETAGPDGLISQMARQIGAQRILVDSVSHFQRLGRDLAEQREVFNSLVNMLKRGGFTVLFTKEARTRTGGEVSFEEYASDAAIRLSYEVTSGVHRVRYLEVTKARGQDFLPGKHTFVMSDLGLRVYPAVPVASRDVAVEEVAPARGRRDRIASGVPGLDELLCGGLVKDSSHLLVGPAGTGKTIMGLQFVGMAAKQGLPSMFVSLRESAAQIRTMADSLSLQLERKGGPPTEVIYQQPAPLNPYAFTADLVVRVREGGHTRVVIDSLDEISAAVGDPEREQVLVRHMVSELRRLGIASMLTTMGPVGTEPAAVAAMPYAGVCDAVITLRHVPVHGEVRRGVTVLKSRGTDHGRDIRPYQITSDGVSIATRRGTAFEDVL